MSIIKFQLPSLFPRVSVSIIMHSSLSLSVAFCSNSTLRHEYIDMTFVYKNVSETFAITPSKYCNETVQYQEFRVPIFANHSWWSFFDYSPSADQTVSLQMSNFIGTELNINLVKLDLVLYNVAPDCQIPEFYVYPEDAIDAYIIFNCSNIIKMEYVCDFNVTSTSPIIESGMVKCPFPPYYFERPLPGAMTPFNLTFKPVTGSNMDFEANTISLTRSPVVTAIIPNRIPSVSNSSITIYGNKFYFIWYPFFQIKISVNGTVLNGPWVEFNTFIAPKLLVKAPEAVKVKIWSESMNDVYEFDLIYDPPISPPSGYINLCHHCLNPPITGDMWCGNIFQGSCQSTSSPNCPANQSFRWFCPISTKITLSSFKFNPTNETLLEECPQISSTTTSSTTTTQSCLINFENPTKIINDDDNSYTYSIKFQFDDLTHGEVITKIDIDLLISSCTNQITFYCSMDDIIRPSNLIKLGLRPVCNESKNNLAQLKYTIENIDDPNSMLNGFLYKEEFHTLNFTLPNDTLINIASVNITLTSYNVDPQISPTHTKPLYISRCDVEDCSVPISVYGKNFYRYEYIGIIEFDNITISTTCSFTTETKRSCFFDLSPLKQVERLTHLLNGTLRLEPTLPNITSTHSPHYASVPIVIFEYPVIWSCILLYSLDNMTVGVIYGSGFQLFSTSGITPVTPDDISLVFNVSVLVGGGSLSIINDTCIYFEISTTHVKENMCVDVIFFDMNNPNCITVDTSHIIPVRPPSDPPTVAPSSPIPTPTPTPTPLPTPTPGPSPTPTFTIPPVYTPTSMPTPSTTFVPTDAPSTPSDDSPLEQLRKFFTENYWFIIILVFLLVVIVLIVFCYVRLRKQRSSLLPLGNTTEEEEEEYFGDIDANILVDSSAVKFDKDLLGKGSFAIVYKGTWRKTIVAIKVMQNTKTNRIEFIQEVSIMLKLRHPNIVSIMGIVSKPYFGIISEFMQRGSLSSILYNENYIIQNHHVCRMMLDTCRGMNYLHESSVIHRDLKCGNLLVDQNWNTKVADFGLSKGIEDYTYTMTSCGTPAYIAPEVIRKQHYSYKADVYSFAICMYETCFRRKPWGETPMLQIIISVGTQGKRPEFPEGIEHEVHPQLIKLMNQTWEDDPDLRPSFEELVETFETLMETIEDNVIDSVGPNPILVSSSRSQSSRELDDLSKPLLSS
eukprot:TRINITY_DN3774_c0_g1_i1.p1 TRINITY_DN3774_c0_g1~~TRINITY_DN3774_c0_g1_i1.p1  ORF type:complete len:1286 (+),score=275.89 TRINITY_DN3774_c0_g1_i1:314-3859(+)